MIQRFVGVAVALALALATLQPVSAQALSRYRVTATPSAATVTKGTQVKITGKVYLRKHSKRTLTLEYRSPGSSKWHRSKKLTAAKNGRFTARAVARATYYWRVCKAKDKKGKAACSKQTLVKAVSVQPSPTPTPTPTPSPSPSPSPTPSSDYRNTNTAAALTIPESHGDYTWTTDTTRWSQRHTDEADGFYLGAAPVTPVSLTIDSIAPTSGSLTGGETVTVTGSGLDTVTGAKMVKAAYHSTFYNLDAPEDSIAVRFKRISATKLLFRAPSWGWGESKLVLVNATSSASATYTYGVVALTSSEFEQAIVEAINAVRATGVTCGHGTVMAATTPVTSDDLLTDVARNYATDRTARENVYVAALANGTIGSPHSRYGALLTGLYQYVDESHKSLNQAMGIKSEALAIGVGLDASAATAAQLTVEGWVNETGWSTDGHCKAIMSPSITKVGVGVIPGDTASGIIAAETK